MVISMTGFGQAARAAAGYRIQIDLKSVNHRYSEVVVRMPREWARYEDPLKQAVLRHIKRGRVDAFVAIDTDKQSPRTVRIDWDLAFAYKQAADQLKERMSLPDEVTLRDLLSIPDLISLQEMEENGEEALAEAMLSCADEALQGLLAMRAKEGAFLLADMEQRIAAIERYRDQAAELAPQAVKEYADKLRSRIQELLQAEPDESRLAMEIALFADRIGIDEELTRLQSHLVQFKSLLLSEEPVGRKLDFLVQEMNREVNTIGSKANHAALTTLVVDMKAELEKMREQIQNIE